MLTQSSIIVIALVAANALAFLIEMTAPRTAVYLFGLVPQLIRQRFCLWQFITYMFLHGSFWHLFFNMFALFIFGRDVAAAWGTKKFAAYYFFTGIGAGICAFIFTNVPTIGASGAIYALLLAYGIMFPNRTILLYFFFPMKAKYLVVVFGIFELFASIAGNTDGIAHIAHLGGMAFGAIFLFFSRWLKRRYRKHEDNRFIEFKMPRPKEDADVDRLLDKILRSGIESLTAQEKAILVRAGKFFAGHTSGSDARQKR